MNTNASERSARVTRRSRRARTSLERRTSAGRRGVLLLVVMSLLMLMAVMCVTFILVGSQTRRIIREEVRAEQKTEDYRKELDGALMQLLRGVKDTNRTSAIGDNDVLRDMYGNDGIDSQITSTAEVYDSAGAAIPSVELRDILVSTPTNVPDLPKLLPGQFNGRVLTMTTGRLRGQSTRIVGSKSELPNDPKAPQRTIWRFRIVAFPGANGWPDANDRFLINGMPFNGTGFGYSPTTNPNDKHWGPTVTLPLKHNGFPLPQIPEALAPFAHVVGYPRDKGGADEDYDAPDPQTMHLAYFEPGNPSTPPVILPSFHRPDLIRYMQKLVDPSAKISAKDWSLADMKAGRVPTLKLINARPLSSDHPKFTGGNPRFNIFGGVNGVTYDVDNDGDGIPESIWIDLGYPVQTTPDGRKFKPLFAIYCTDLDGRLNVNAHGNVIQAERSRVPVPLTAAPADVKSSNSDTPDIRDWAPDRTNFPSDVATAAAMLGQGCGVADINLLPLFEAISPGYGIKSYADFFLGAASPQSGVAPNITPGVFAEGRYGELMQTQTAQMPLPGFTNWNPLSSQGSRSDFWSYWVKHAEVSDGYYSGYSALSSKNSLTGLTPTDLWGRGMTVVDIAGNPLMLPPPHEWNGLKATCNPEITRQIFRIDERKNNPYSLDLSRSAVRDSRRTTNTVVSGNDTNGMFDNPFTVGELETLLRPFDADAPILSGRLRALLRDLPARQYGSQSQPAVDDLLRRIVTTDSFDVAAIPVVPVSKTEGIAITEFSQRAAPLNHFSLTMADLVIAKMRRGGMSDAAIKGKLPDLLPPEVIAGQKFDLNRPFGNGIDDNGNNIVDEPGEGESPVSPAQKQVFGKDSLALGGGVRLAPDAAKNGDVRYLYAKYLYVMAMTLADDQYDKLSPDPAVSGATEQRLFLARRLAQWAVNVVDYRDPDAIMTAFEYDTNPFDGWDVDGRLDTNESTEQSTHNAPKPPPLPQTSSRDVVWGCEAPDLLISETMAFHDLRVNDTAKDPTKKSMTDSNPDPDPDQIRIPEGSTFIELHCPRSANGTTALPSELYANGKLDLERWAGNAPVWRMAISADSCGDLALALKQNPDVFSPEPFPNRFAKTMPNNQNLDPAGIKSFAPGLGTGVTIRFERVVWFSRRPPTATVDKNVTFYNRNSELNSPGPSLLAPGQYALVGPRRFTYLGSRNPQPATDFPDLSNRMIRIPLPQRADDPDEQVPLSYLKSDKSLERYSGLHPSRGGAFDRIQPTVGIVCASLPVSQFQSNAGWQNSDAPQNKIGVGLNVSEPLFSGQYYAKPTYVSKSGVKDAYGKYDNTAPFLNRPEDLRLTTSPIALQANQILGPTSQLSSASKDNFRTVFLQRLANPLAPFDPDLNPYITVDFMTIDVTVFSGEWTRPNGTNKQPLLSRQRGNKSAVADMNWLSVASTKSGPAVPDAGNSYFTGNFNHSLGYLNESFGEPWPKAAKAAPEKSFLVGYSNKVIESGGNATPWFNWADRPFISTYELMMVPACSPPRRGAEAALHQLDDRGEFLRDAVMTTDSLSKAYEPDPATRPDRLYPQYLNFFSSAADRSPKSAPQFHRLLDFVHVPSRFVGTEKYLNPNSLANGVDNEQSLVTYLRPPFNKISEYREPGRVNINTVSSRIVWDGVVNNLQSANLPKNGMPNFEAIKRSRKGEVTGMVPGADPADRPTLFANPFRSGLGGAYPLPGAVDLAKFASVNATFLRQGESKGPLFAMPQSVSKKFNDPLRHPYFFYQNFQKISNLLTTRSNVYAVWVTVGYFEVAPASDLRNLPIEYQKFATTSTVPQADREAILAAIYPDGYVLGQELNADTGEINRHRAFYIFDRTIPVGYERGEDHNVDNAIILRRLIE